MKTRAAYLLQFRLLGPNDKVIFKLIIKHKIFQIRKAYKFR